MPKIVFLIIVSCLLSLNSISQITKGYWLNGGHGNLTVSKSTVRGNMNTSATYIDLILSPDIGYFVKDKFALGLRSGFSYLRNTDVVSGGRRENKLIFDAGPFARFYFLKETKQYNIFIDGCFKYGKYSWLESIFLKNGGPIIDFSVMAGPVVFLNPTIGIEFALGYNVRKENQVDWTRIDSQSFQVGIGFKVHLQKK